MDKYMDYKVGDRIIRIKGFREGQEATVYLDPYIDRDGDLMIPIKFDSGFTYESLGNFIEKVETTLFELDA